MEYPSAKSHVEVRSVALKVNNKSMRLVIHESPDVITFFIGGHTKYCIYGFIYKEGGMMAKFKGISIGDFSKIHYNLECSLEHDFKRGSDTNMLLKLLLSYIHKHYPYVKQLKFEDASYRTCDDGQLIDLAEMSYITTGKTWYEKNFGATLDPSSRAQFKRAEQNFKEIKEHAKWDDFSRSLPKDSPVEFSEMKKIYEEASTWQEFFGPLREKMGVETFCPFISPWINSFMAGAFGMKFIQFRYLMPVEGNTIPFTEHPYSRGGRRFTRKNLKLRPLALME